MIAEKRKLLFFLFQTSGGGSGRRESAPALLTGYENLLAHLKSQGALLNAVKPELLLDIIDFRSALACAHNSALACAHSHARHHHALLCCLLSFFIYLSIACVLFASWHWGL